MYPNTYLQTFWQLDLRYEIFVAMSFDPQYTARFKQIIEPAINNIAIDGHRLAAKRVDLSKSGDSILTEIMDGVAHSQMVLADVSVTHRDPKTKHWFRNANVMYEVGLALACRQPTEVLLIRDDNDPFLFDVSTIPHLTINFTDPKTPQVISNELLKRLQERNTIRDARVEIAYASLSSEEKSLVLDVVKAMPTGQGLFGPTPSEGINLNFSLPLAYHRLLDKRIIRHSGKFDNGAIAYGWTTLGWQVVEKVNAEAAIKMEMMFADGKVLPAVVPAPTPETPK